MSTSRISKQMLFLTIYVNCIIKSVHQSIYVLTTSSTGHSSLLFPPTLCILVATLFSNCERVTKMLCYEIKFIWCITCIFFFNFFPSSPPAVSAPRTTPPWPSRRVWCPKTVRHLIGHRGVPALRPAGPPTCLLVTVSGHGSWHRSQSGVGSDVLPLRKKKLATS